MILKSLIKLVPKKVKNYEFFAQFVPSKYRGQVDRIVHQIMPDLLMRDSMQDETSDEQIFNNEDIDRKRQNLVRNMVNEEGQFPKGFTDEAHEQSLRDHQAQSAFSASPVNGAGNVGGKVNSNMSHRNYQ